MTGTRTAFNYATRTFTIRYGRHSKFQTADVFMPDWTPDNSAENGIPEYPVMHVFAGGTWYNQGWDAKDVTGTFAESTAQMLSNTLGAVVITHDYRPGGFGRPAGEDVERLFWPEILDDGALVIQFFKTIAEDPLFTTTHGDRPLSRDPEKIFCFGTSSGGHRLAFSQIMPDGSFDYSPNRMAGDYYIPQYSHLANPLLLSTTPLMMSGFSKGGTGYGYYGSYGAASWAYALFRSSVEVDPPYTTTPQGTTWGWDQIPMGVKRQSDLGEHIRADNPRVSEIGLYLTSAHVGNGIPRGNIENDPTGDDARSFRRRYWRYADIGNPAPIESITAVAEDDDGTGVNEISTVSAATAGTPGKAKFVISGSAPTSDWVADGYTVGITVASSGFSAGSNNHWEVDSVSTTELVVIDLAEAMTDVAVGSAGHVAGGGHFDLHDEASCYVAYDEMTTAGNTRCRLRAGGTGNTNPDSNTVSSLATTDDVKDWLISDFAWVEPA